MQWPETERFNLPSSRNSWSSQLAPTLLQYFPGQTVARNICLRAFLFLLLYVFLWMGWRQSRSAVLSGSTGPALTAIVASAFIDCCIVARDPATTWRARNDWPVSEK